MKKTEARRQAILEAAAEVFAGMGYDRASMSDICSRVGFSKVTLYAYFPSKEALYAALLVDALDACGAAMRAALTAPAAPGAALAERLVQVGAAYLGVMYSPRLCTVRRLAIMLAGRTDMQQSGNDLGTLSILAGLAAYLDTEMRRGGLRMADPAQAALQLKALFEADWIDAMLYQTCPAPAPDTLAASAVTATASFLAAYGIPDPRPTHPIPHDTLHDTQHDTQHDTPL